MPAPALLYHIESPAKDWASFDLRVIRQYDQYTRHWGGDAAKLSVYQLRAFEWMVTSFRDSPMMIPHLQDILKTIPSSIALSAVLGQWNVTLWEDVSTSDVDIALKNPTSVHRDLRLAGDAPPPAIPYPVIHHQEGIRLLFHHRYWMALADSYRFRYLPDNEIERGQWSTPWQTTDLHFLIPFPAVEALWSHESVAVRKRSLILLRSLEESWNSCSSCKDDDSQRHQRERCAFVSALARHINRKDCVSQLLTSKRGQAFIKFIHNEVINQRLHHEFSATTHRDWPKAVKRAQEVGRLPDDHFTTPPDWGESTPNLSVPPSVRYSVDTLDESMLGWRKRISATRRKPLEDPHNHRVLTYPDVSTQPVLERSEVKGEQQGPVDHDSLQNIWVDPRTCTPIPEIPLPPGWEQRATVTGRRYFIDHNNYTATWDDPRERSSCSGREEVGES
ncbi:hypothetical protein VNI00_010765 [Paramarasmius palmivorus]|uniref:WW domain-containing protein n=1 Tax=Paramarasmius palmivorus TaxID=297713 RepID=A0AAW0CFD8_9AGAR